MSFEVETSTRPTHQDDSNIILFRCRDVMPEPEYRVCRTGFWLDNLFAYVKRHTTSRLQCVSLSMGRASVIKKVLLAWLIRYKCQVAVLRPFNANEEAVVPPVGGYCPILTTLQKIQILVRDIDNVFDCLCDNSQEPDFIRAYTGSTILIQHTISSPSPRVQYILQKNSGYTSLVTYLQRNTSPTSSKWGVVVAICAWLRRHQASIKYEGDAKPLRLSVAIQMVEAIIRFESSAERTATGEQTNHEENEITNQTNPIQLTGETSSVIALTGKAKIITPIRTKRVPAKVQFSSRRTRGSSALMSKYLDSASRSKEKIQYTSDVGRHFIGQPPKLTPLPALMYRTDVTQPPIDKATIAQRIDTLVQLEAVHSALIHMEILSPRDQWEEWINNFNSEPGCDPAFMCLLIILMSSSTSDIQLAEIVPRLFSAGLTSACGVIEVAQQYGVNAFCSLISESGQYYQNAERILNAADYFVQRHHGRIPSNITMLELCSLYGVKYKTAAIVLVTAFRRVDAIPSDIHVIRWSSMLGWCKSSNDGLECSKMIESWLPQTNWESVNPMFGSFGQILVSNKRNALLQLVAQHPSPLIHALFQKAAKLYNRA